MNKMLGGLYPAARGTISETFIRRHIEDLLPGAREGRYRSASGDGTRSESVPPARFDTSDTSVGTHHGGIPDAVAHGTTG
jgi:hypothetical protein